MTARCGCEAAEKGDEEEDGEGGEAALEASFRGDGYAVYPGFSVCDKTVVSFEVRTMILMIMMVLMMMMTLMMMMMS